MSDLTPTETGGVVIAILTALGTAVKWLFGRRDGHVAKLEGRVAALEQELRDVWLAFSWVTAELHTRDPDNPALSMAARILREKFPLDPNTPPDMRDLLSRMK